MFTMAIRRLLRRTPELTLKQIVTDLRADHWVVQEGEVLARLRAMESEDVVRSEENGLWRLTQPEPKQAPAEPTHDQAWRIPNQPLIEEWQLRLPLREVGRGRSLLVFTGAGAGDSVEHWSRTVEREIDESVVADAAPGHFNLLESLFRGGPVWAWGSKTQDLACGVSEGDVVLAYGPRKCLEFGFVALTGLFHAPELGARLWIRNRDPEPYTNVVLLGQRTPAIPRIGMSEFAELWGYKSTPQGWARPKKELDPRVVAGSLEPYFQV